MKYRYLSILILAMSLVSFSSFSQSENDEPLLGLPGDNLDLYAVLDVFQQSKTIEDFEKSLNEESTGINNLDLDGDGNIDFIKVVTEKDGDDFLFILQDPVSDKETQDVAVISVSKDAAGKVSMQIIGDETLYGKDYVVEPSTTTSPGVTANPAYVGDDPVTVNVAATTEVIVVESTPVVQYVYSPVYVPYYPTYYYGHPPYWWRPVAVIGIGIYRHNHWHRHGHYHGGRGGSVHVHNSVNINNYNNNKRNTSNKVNNNVNKGNFNTAGKGGTRPSTSQAGRGNGSGGASNKASTSQAGRAKGGASTSNRASTSNNKASTANRASTSPSTSQANRSSSASNRSSSPSTSNRSSSANRSSGASRSGGSRGGGGGRRR